MGQTIVTSSVVKPNSLKMGDTIAIVSPAAPTPLEQNEAGQDALEQGVSLLETLGYQVKLMPHVRKKCMYLAGSDTERLADLMAAFTDPTVKAILCARGGYGCMRLLSQLDFQLIRNHPKILVGFSDVTALLNPIYEQCGLLGFYGPMLTSNLVHPEPYSQQELFRMLSGDIGAGYQIINRDPYHCIHPGTVEAPLMGGNLSLLAALCGTSYQPKPQGHILFIEDWKEKYYSLDRQFQQLKMAGMLDGIAGLLLCDFSEIEPEPEKDLADFLAGLMRELLPTAVPIGYGFSVGHGEETATLPIGCRAQFNSKTGTLTLLEASVLA